MALRLRRGTNAQRQTITPVEGELLFTTDTQQLYVGAINPGTGLPYPGGVGVSSPVTSVNGKTGPVQLVSSDLSEGVTNLFYQDERAQDAAAALFLGSTGTNGNLTVGTDNKVDVMAKGRYIALRITSTGAAPWRVRSIDFDIQASGAY
jgi:hypothetical protein